MRACYLCSFLVISRDGLDQKERNRGKPMIDCIATALWAPLQAKEGSKRMNTKRNKGNGVFNYHDVPTNNLIRRLGKFDVPGPHNRHV